MFEKYNPEDRKAADTLRDFAKKHGCTFKEYNTSKGEYAHSDQEHAFVVEWEHEFIVALAINGSQFAPPEESIAHLKHLQVASIRQTGESIAWISKLEHIKVLFLEVWRDEVVTEWACADTLRDLYLQYPQNGIARKFPFAVRKLSELRSISVDARYYSVELPDWLFELKNLETMELSNCHLLSIPYGTVKTGLHFLSEREPWRKSGINLYNVKLQEGDLSVFFQSKEFIRHYYEGEQEKTRECKVIFLGDGGVGKSSLINRIRRDAFDPNLLPTNGIDTVFWTTSLEDGAVRVRMLDFGGQEIMHAMHRCFLTTNAIYVIVCGSRDDSSIDREAARWLETVRAFAEGCPVILTLNKVDQNPNVSVNERILRERNSDLRCTVKSSAKWAREIGVAELINAIRREIPGCLGLFNVNKNILGIKRELERMGENGKDILTSDEYQTLCAKYSITQPERQMELLKWFQSLGIAYYYSNGSAISEEMRVLNPAWLTNAIYRLILRGPNTGFIPHKEIKELLRNANPKDIMPDKSYNAMESEFILSVMRTFQMSHPFPVYDEDGVEIETEMIPMKMGKTPPESVNQFSKEEALHLRWTGTYLPSNIIHRLIIQMCHDLDRHRVWRTGACFQGNGWSALAEMSEVTLDVYVVSKDFSWSYMTPFRNRINQILQALNIQAKEVICFSVNGREGHIPYEAAWKAYKDQKDEVLLYDILEYVSPTVLLRDYPVRETSDGSVDVFISYHTQSAGNIVQQIVANLERTGISCWYAPRNIENSSDKEFASAIADAISRCKIFLLILNSEAIRSGHVLNETHLAATRSYRHENISLLPFRIDNYPLSDSMRYYIGRFQIMNGGCAPGPYRILELVNQIQTLLGLGDVSSNKSDACDS